VQHFAFVEILAACARCGSSLPVVGLAPSVTCSHCLCDSPIDPGVFRLALGSLVERLPSFGVGGFERVVGEGSLAKVEVRRGLGGPACTRCNQMLTCPPAGGVGQCRGCAAPVEMEVAPDWLRRIAPAITWVIAPRFVDAPKAPVATACVGCGAPLTVDGTSRSVPCGHCRVTNVLPDSVWSIFHPPRALAPIHLAVDVASLDKPLPNPSSVVWLAVVAAVFLFLTLGLWALLLGLVSLAVPDALGGPVAAYLELGWATLVGLGCFTIVVLALRRTTKQKAARLPVNELVGRMHDTGAGLAGSRVFDVALEAAEAPGIVLAVVRGQKASEQDWLRLGGEGAAVRAWARRTGAIVGDASVLLEPSRLHCSPKVVSSEPTQR
jgi:hypothetical protein